MAEIKAPCGGIALNADDFTVDDNGVIKSKAKANGYVLPAATKSALGGVKQATKVNEAAGENVTKAEFKALLDALKAAGIMANA